MAMVSDALIQSCLPHLTGKTQRVAGGHFLSKMALVDLAVANPVRRIEVKCSVILLGRPSLPCAL